MFGLHMPELIIILVVALLIFGPKKLPEMGASIGKSIKEFRKGMNEISHPKEENDEVVKVPDAEVKQRELASKSVNYEFQDVSAKPVQSEASYSEASRPEMSRE